MANISNYLEEAILNHVMRNTEYERPSTVYAGLVSDDANDTNMEEGSLTHEITGYTGNRKAITFKAPTQEGGKATIKNDGAIDFLEMPETTVKYVIVCDAEESGNILWWCPLSPTKNTNEGDTFRIIDEGLVLDLD